MSELCTLLPLDYEFLGTPQDGQLGNVAAGADLSLMEVVDILVYGLHLHHILQVERDRGVAQEFAQVYSYFFLLTLLPRQASQESTMKVRMSVCGFLSHVCSLIVSMSKTKYLKARFRAVVDEYFRITNTLQQSHCSKHNTSNTTNITALQVLH